MDNNYRIFLCFVAFFLLQLVGNLQVKAGNESWMAGIPDNTFLSQLSIPGAHDAGTGHGVNNIYVFVSGSTYATTQEKTLTQLWNSGVRAFDLRPAVDGSRLRIYHGIVSTNLYFDDALVTLCGLLDSHPTETCIVLMRHESEGDDNNSSWGTKVKELLGKSPVSAHAVNFNPMAKMGDMRGKLLIISRDTYDTNPVGGYITGWGFNPNFSNQQGGKISGIGTQGRLYVQDFYDVSASGAPATKTSSIQRMMQFSSSENTDPGLFVVNHTSGYSKTANVFGNNVATSDGYRDNAQTQNAKAIEFINNISGPTGIVLMDFAGEDASGSYQVKGQSLTNAIIANNAKGTLYPDFFQAMSTIQEGNEYMVTTFVEGTKYYLTTAGKLSANEMDAGIFTMRYGPSGYYGRSFYFTWKNGSDTYTFTNPNQNRNANGTFSTDNYIVPRKKDRDSPYDSQLLFPDNEGKYAIRATNVVYTEDGSWAQYAADTWWAIKNSTINPPRPGYKKGVAEYIWQLEKPSSSVNVTYNIYFNGKKISEVEAAGERNAPASLPSEFIHDFCAYTYSPQNITNSSIRVTVRWVNGPFTISTDTGAKYWYNLKAGRLKRYVGWEDREPYHPHAYDETSVEQYPETELYATDLVRASDAYQWAFMGNPIQGFKIINRLKGEDYSLTVDGTASSVQGVADIKNTVLREGDFRWTAHANNDGFSLSLNEHDNFYVNTHGGPHGFLQVWETANARTDLGSQLIVESVPSANVLMTQIGDAYYSTLCMPYEVVLSGAKAYVLDNDNIEEAFALLTLANDTVPAGTPVLLRGETGTVSLAYKEGFAAQPFTGTALTGLYLPESHSGVLTLQNKDDAPYFCTFEGDTLQPNQVYLKLDDTSVQSLLAKFSDIEDGINAIQDSRFKIKNHIYNLIGQRLSGMQKGINIVAGKKILK